MEVTNNQTRFAGSSVVSFDDGIVFSRLGVSLFGQSLAWLI